MPFTLTTLQRRRIYILYPKKKIKTNLNLIKEKSKNRGAYFTTFHHRRPPREFFAGSSSSEIPDAAIAASRRIRKRYTMHHLLSKVSRRVLSSAKALSCIASGSSVVTKQYFSTISVLQRKFENTQKIVVPCNLLNVGPRGFSRPLSFATGFNPLQRKPLESILDVERAKTKSPEELADIWDDYHLGRGHIGLSMKARLYQLLEQRTADCRYFVIPLWKGSGYTSMFVQVQMPYMLFTGLEDYKARGTQAAPYFTASYYKDFADSKDLVLIRGDIVFTSKLTDSEAKWLLETAQSFYLNDVRYKLVERFNKETRDFEFKDVLQALEMPIL